MFANTSQPQEFNAPPGKAPFQMGLSKEDVALSDLALGAKVEIQTRRHLYEIENCGGGMVLISGHPKYCPKPVVVDLIGSSGNDSLFRIRGILRGTHMEFMHPVYGLVRTSEIKDIREIESPEHAPEAKAS